jgi:hypothetical protein
MGASRRQRHFSQSPNTICALLMQKMIAPGDMRREGIRVVEKMSWF